MLKIFANTYYRRRIGFTGSTTRSGNRRLGRSHPDNARTGISPMATNYPIHEASFDCTVEDGLARIDLRKGAFMLGPHLDEKDQLFSVFEDLDRSDKVKAVLLFNSADALTSDEHRRYFDQVSGYATSGQYEIALRMVERENHALTQYSLLATRFSKVLVSCHSGEIASPFFGASLVSDFRLAGGDMSYRLSHVDLGLPPGACLSYLLPKFIGRGRATHWLLSGGTIDAETAHRLGLVTAMIDQVPFVEACLEWVDAALARGTSHVPDTRQLLNRDFEALAPALANEEIRRTRAALSRKR